MRFDGVRDDTTAKAAIEALDKLTPLGIKDTELAFSMNFRAAMWCNGPLASTAEDDEAAAAAWSEKAKKYATRAKEIGSEDEGMVEELDKILEA
jgi:hypothetical protein